MKITNYLRNGIVVRSTVQSVYVMLSLEYKLQACDALDPWILHDLDSHCVFYYDYGDFFILLDVSGTQIWTLFFTHHRVIFSKHAIKIICLIACWPLYPSCYDDPANTNRIDKHKLDLAVTTLPLAKSRGLFSWSGGRLV